MADPKVSLQIAAVDAFSNTFSAVQNELVAMQAEFNKASRGMASDSQNVTQRIEKLGSMTEKPARDIGGLNGLLGQMAQYVVAAFSVGAIIGFAKEAFNASLQMDAINSKLKVMTGSAEKAGQEWEFIRAEAKRLGLDLQSTADSYSSFAVATKNTSMEGEGARKMFTSVAEAAAALHQPAEQTSRVLYQFQQMLSKGKINMEDLKTASESFPGLLKQVADALGITTAQLLDQMQKGELMAADVLPKLADQLHKTYGQAATEAANQGRGALNKLTTAVFELKLAFGQASAGGEIVSWLTAIVNVLKQSISWIQQATLFWAGLIDKASAWVNAGGFIGLMTGGEAARAKLKAEFAAIDANVQELWDKTVETSKRGAQKQAGEDARNSQRRRDEAIKTGEDLAKIELTYAKAVGAAEVELTQEAAKAYQERIKDAKAYYDQKKAAAKSNDEEVAWEQIKTNKLREMAKQHARDTEIIQAQMVQRAVDLRKEGLENEFLNIRQQAANRVITSQQAETRITRLTVASLRDQYEARRAVAAKIKEIYGDNSAEYKSSLKEQQTSHKAYVDANLAAYKKYSDEIKSLDQQIADFRLSIQQKVADLAQKDMTESAKYADNKRRFDEAVNKARIALAQGEHETALKFNKQAEDLASRLADKKIQINTQLEELEIQRKKRLADIDQQSLGQQTDQQKKATDAARANAEFDVKKAELLKQQEATTEGITTATAALNTVEQLGVSIMEAKRAASADALAKLKEIQAMPLDPKNLQINLDESALAKTRAAMSDLTKTETKTIVIRTVGGGSEQAVFSGGSTSGFYGGGKVMNGSPFRDSVSAILANDEWVINNRAAGFWGDNVMAAINNPLSAAGQQISAMIRSASPANAAPLGTLNLQVAGGTFPVQGPIDVLSQLTTAVRRLQKTRPQ